MNSSVIRFDNDTNDFIEIIIKYNDSLTIVGIDCSQSVFLQNNDKLKVEFLLDDKLHSLRSNSNLAL